MPSRARHRAAVDEELSVDGVGDAPLEGTHGFFFGFAFGDLALEERAPRGVRVAVWVIAAMWRAWFSCRFPRRDRRWVIRPPEDTSMGAVPVYAAN